MRNVTLVVLASLTVGSCSSAAREPIVDPAFSFVDDLIESGLEESGTPGAALVVVRDGAVVHARGYGYADAESRTRADLGTVWPLASVTKVLTALAVMRLAETGDVALGVDVNRYLKRARVPDTYPAPITVADLLRHTSGLDELPGRRFERPRDVPPFHAFMATHLVRHRPAGELTSYSSYGMALAGLLIEEVTGASYGEHLDKSVFQPLAMTNTRIMDEPGEESGLATGYEIEDGKAQRIGYEWYATPPVASAVTSGRDIGRLLLALTSGEPAILSPKSLQQMVSTQATVHPDVPGWGYGFQLDEVNGHRVAEHGGDIGGFASLLVIVPAKRFGFFVVHHGEGSSLRYEVREALFDRFFPGVSARQPSMARVDLAPYAGRYRASWVCHTCDDPPPVPEFDVSVNDDGTLSLWGNRWIPIEQDLFAREDGRGKLAFRRDESGRIVALSGGSWRVGERMR